MDLKELKKRAKVRITDLQRLYPDLLEEVYRVTECPRHLPLRAALELLRAEITLPKCKVCSNPAHYSIAKGYWTNTCSAVCRSTLMYQEKGSEINSKKIATSLVNFGVSHHLKLESQKDLVRKTCEIIYGPGIDNVSKALEVKKAKETTCYRKRGVKHHMMLAEVQETKELTCLKRYGHRFPSQSPKIQEAHEQNNLAKYGHKNVMDVPEIRKRYLEKAKQFKESPNYIISRQNFIKTMKTRWGGCGASSLAIRLKMQETCEKNLGVRSPLKLKKISSKVQATRLKKYEQKLAIEILLKLQSKEFWIEEYEIKQKTFAMLASELNISEWRLVTYFCKYSECKLRARICRVSSEEKQLNRFIETYIPTNSQTSLKQLGSELRQFLDIYIPSKNLAFEYNGLYWHSEEYRDKNYHLEKTLACEKLGIRLVHIWEDDWFIKQDLMKRKIKALLGLEERKVFARKCQVIIPTFKQRREFYNLNHIKGFGPGSICYALKYQEEIVAMITFKVTSQGYDLNRFATSCSVPGSFSKLLEHFKRNHSWEKIYTFADRSWSQGDVYLKTGFKLVEIQPPTFYGVEGKRINRLSYTHTLLAKRFPDLKGSQFQIMDQAGIRRVWDCGQLKFEMLNPETKQDIS